MRLFEIGERVKLADGKQKHINGWIRIECEVTDRAVLPDGRAQYRIANRYWAGLVADTDIVGA